MMKIGGLVFLRWLDVAKWSHFKVATVEVVTAGSAATSTKCLLRAASLKVQGTPRMQ